MNTIEIILLLAIIALLIYIVYEFKNSIFGKVI